MIAFAQHPATGTPRIGEYWPGQGGIYAGIMPDYEGESPYHLVLSMDEAVHVEWGAYSKSHEGARSESDGYANTAALTQCGHSHPAAQWAAHYQKDGHRDFHLPAQRELEMVAATLADRFSRSQWYWSSTERSDTAARGSNFNGMPFGGMFKHFLTGRARAVRRIFVSTSESPGRD